MKIIQQKQIQLSLGALIVGAIAIAFAPIFVRLSACGPVATAFWRIFLSLPLFGGWLLIHKRENTCLGKNSSPPGYIRLIIPGLFFAGDLAVWHWSIKLTTVANATLLANFAPIFVTLSTWMLFGQRVTKTFLLGLVLALGGAYFLCSKNIQFSNQNFMGDLLGFVTAIFYAGYIMSMSEARKYFSTVCIMTWSGFTSVVILLPIALISGEIFWAGTLHGWLVLIGLALISQVGGQGLIAYALAHLPAAFSSVTLLIQPLFAAIFAVIFLNEILAFTEVIGGIIVLCGIYIARVGSRII